MGQNDPYGTSSVNISHRGVNLFLQGMVNQYNVVELLFEVVGALNCSKVQ